MSRRQTATKPDRNSREGFRQASEEWRRGNVGRAIFNATKKFEQDVLASLADNGFPEIRLVHLNLYRNLEFDGTRLTDLAARASMTKQGMQELVDRAEKAGFVERRPDPHDGRAKMVAFSGNGLKLFEALRQAIRFAEQNMIDSIGNAQVDLIGQWLRAYTQDKIDASSPPEEGSD
ncbi:MAG: MarR family transcriptional regulator [Hyphomicrobiales bacterium]|nr:MarR family transcriptional regulator [Hyphomicrobiales bacterium]